MSTVVTGPAPLSAGVSGAAVARMRSVVAELASPRYAGRRVGSDGGRAAAGWLAGHLAGLGTAVDVDKFAVVGAVREVYATPVLRWRDEGATSELAFRREFCEHFTSADQWAERTGPLAVVDGVEVAGAWVLDRGLSAERVARLAAAGAAGVLVPRGVDDAGWMPKMIAGPAPVPLPVLAVRTDLHDRMSAAARAGGGSATAAVPVRTVDVAATNVYGVFRAPAPGGLSMLLTAHFDGVGDDPDGTRFPAAADNASGVAVVVEAAHRLRQSLPDGIGLAVALLDAEEVGAQGSARHAPRVPAGTYVINIDGAAALDQAAAVEAGGPAHPLLAALDQAGRATGVPLRAAAVPSDNRRYAAAGLPAIGIGMGLPGYQTPAETADRVQPATLDAAMRLLVATAERLAATSPLNRRRSMTS